INRWKAYEIRRRRRLLSEGPDHVGRAVSNRSAISRRGNRGRSKRPGELPEAPPDRTQAWRAGVESEGPERRLYARAPSVEDYDGGSGADHRRGLRPGRMPRGRLERAMPACGQLRDARCVERGARERKRDPGWSHAPVASRTPQDRAPLPNLIVQLPPYRRR